ncbi:2-amino-4-hydroxy-6-hydroxymethyldihydropteridine diphosphokinase [Parvularcula sp. ZS-1/3]|uniref:2-amino-4-hydroxy-6-hydroxymethyldihydropteridine pyrophosphokinase n=1 Tax=Parvularcula mediterranea TaxID=2732508 RepID=A0A7Y3RNH6_9PROT|nr:2-amino-4-hydroxy-6-hydroxymethyldihydropteridine diphosphokinase [Parvularcula mediterranea]
MTNTVKITLIGLGANKPWLGKGPGETVLAAAEALKKLGGEALLSPLYRSSAWPDPSGPEYRNAVLRLESALAPEALLGALLATEAAFGRTRSDDPALRYAPRTLDLDLLAVGDEMRDTGRLTLPHPRIAERDFVLLPLKDVAPEWRHPVTKRTASEMINALPKIGASLAT